MAVRISKHMFWPLFSDDQWGDSEHGGQEGGCGSGGLGQQAGFEPLVTWGWREEYDQQSRWDGCWGGLVGSGRKPPWVLGLGRVGGGLPLAGVAEGGAGLVGVGRVPFGCICAVGGRPPRRQSALVWLKL